MKDPGTHDFDSMRPPTSTRLLPWIPAISVSPANDKVTVDAQATPQPNHSPTPNSRTCPCQYWLTRFRKTLTVPHKCTAPHSLQLCTAASTTTRRPSTYVRACLPCACLPCLPVICAVQPTAGQLTIVRSLGILVAAQLLHGQLPD